MPSPNFSWEFALYGALGGVAGMIIKHPLYFEFPRFVRTECGWRLYYGSMKFIVISAIAGCVGDRHPVNAIVWGLAGWQVLDWLGASLQKQLKALTGTVDETWGPNHGKQEARK